jgi:pimeloyl-ACP methyl ester carboxylesterase
MIESPGLTDEELGAISRPCLLFCGDSDPFYPGALQAARHMNKARFLSMPGLDHISALMRSDLVVPHVKKFIADTGG